MDGVDHLPITGVQITVMIFGGLSLLILGGGLFLAGRRHHKNNPGSDPSGTTTSRILTDLILSQQARQGFDRGAIGQALGEGGESKPPGP